MQGRDADVKQEGHRRWRAVRGGAQSPSPTSDDQHNLNLQKQTHCQAIPLWAPIGCYSKSIKRQEQQQSGISVHQLPTITCASTTSHHSSFHSTCMPHLAASRQERHTLKTTFDLGVSVVSSFTTWHGFWGALHDRCDKPCGRM
eukprot:scaffold174475_cov16-Tisochrysis_lutea.AAC.1